MDFRQFFASLSEERGAVDGGSEAHLCAEGAGSQNREGPGAAPETSHPELQPRCCKGLVFLEVFSGSGHLSTALQRIGISTRCLDISHGPLHDVTRKDVQKMIFRFLRSGKCAGIWFGTPCTSFSRARDRSGRIRGDTGLDVYGLRNLSERDRQKVCEGNLLASITVALCQCAQLHGVPWFVENPLHVTALEAAGDHQP